MSVYYAFTMRCSTRRRSSTLNALKTISLGSTKSIIKDGRKRWDDWILQDRVRKFTEANKELATQLQYQVKASKSGQQKMSASKSGKRVTGGRGAVPSSGLSSTRGSEERNASVPLSQSARGPRRNRDYDVETEDDFLNRPSIKLEVPDHIKAILVDDWENVTKNQQLVPLPAAKPVSVLLQDYFEDEKMSRVPGSAEMDFLVEVIAGMKEYFDKCLGRILLYRFERNQYAEVCEGWDMSTGEFAGKTPCETYGAEHLCRLLVSLPELIAQTNMDQQSVNRLRDELIKLTNWIGKHATTYFVREYEMPSQEYCEKSQSVS
ncbi:Chromatin modification-related protein eaf3 [Golovinomyces cichoracearum]|uniref:Chromatin modification-related protein EAF3 n=1 Tax=Golovinomyces cichoracearum TaxID=62708 RepID=A0A420IRV8_9PEZI|nr:Chromatin modification-related protein eaf3 [Golovinomyces cichoracearum]